LSDVCGPAAHQLDDEDYQRNHQKQVDKGSGNVETKSEEPQNQQNYENCPEHCPSPLHTALSCAFTLIHPALLGLQLTQGGYFGWAADLYGASGQTAAGPYFFENEPSPGTCRIARQFEEGVPQQALIAAVQVAVHGIESEVTNSVLH